MGSTAYLTQVITVRQHVHLVNSKDEHLPSELPYSGKVWWAESWANLVNCLQIAKLKPSKLVAIYDNPLADLFIHQLFPAKCLKRVNAPNIFPEYTVVGHTVV